MFKFEIIQKIKPNAEILEIIKSYVFTTKNGVVKHLMATNLQFIEPIEYRLTSPVVLTILEYKINEISNKNFYVKEYKQKYNLKEIKQILMKLKI